MSKILRGMASQIFSFGRGGRIGIVSDLMERGRIVRFHPYRSDNPWTLGNKLILQQTYREGDDLDKLERKLASDDGKIADNHYGWTLRVESKRFRIHFSDWTAYVWEVLS